VRRQKDYSRQGLRGHQLTLGKLRTKAKGSWMRIKGEKGYSVQSKEENKGEG